MERGGRIRSSRSSGRSITADPYGSLDPTGTGDPASLYPEVGAVAALTRGIRKRCHRCGESDTFLTWFHSRTLCPECGLRWEKEEGGFLGAMVINYSVATAGWLTLLLMVLIATVPDVPVAPLLIASCVVLVTLPLWFYPRAKMLWAAVEFMVLRSQPDYRAPVRRDPRTKALE